MIGPVLVASAVLAVIFDEPGAEDVATCIPGAEISAVNLAEVLAKLHDLGVPDDTIAAIMDGLQLVAIPFDAAHAQESARLRSPTRPAGLSLGDRACLAAAKLRGARAVSADRAWARVPADAGVQIDLVR